MFSEREIIHFPKFCFKDGGNTKPKFLLVLLKLDELVVLYTLPSSQEYGSKAESTGCIHNVYKSAREEHCYYFRSEDIIGENGFSFRKDTRLFFTRSFVERDKNDLFILDFEELDILNETIYLDILKCIIKGEEVPVKYIEPIKARIQKGLLN